MFQIHWGDTNNYLNKYIITKPDNYYKENGQSDIREKGLFSLVIIEKALLKNKHLYWNLKDGEVKFSEWSEG